MSRLTVDAKEAVLRSVLQMWEPYIPLPAKKNLAVPMVPAAKLNDILKLPKGDAK